jgi:hypothetical protein
MSRSNSRLGARPRAAWAIALWLVVGVVAPAAATPVTVSFAGHDGFGVGAVPPGFSEEEPDYLVDAEGYLSVIDQDVLISSVHPTPPTAASGNTVTSIWTVESSYDLLGDVYMVFVTTVPSEIGFEVVEYEDPNVGLSIDPDLDWVLIHTIDIADGRHYYYPAIELGFLAPGETSAPFAMNFVVNEPLQQVGNTYVLPRFQLALGFTPTLVPEPSAAALLGLGLVLLATARRLRS